MECNSSLFYLKEVKNYHKKPELKLNNYVNK